MNLLSWFCNGVDAASEHARELRARAGGYFWLPCPRCGRMFGGNEWKGNIDLGNGSGLGTCCPGDTTLEDPAYATREQMLWYTSHAADVPPWGGDGS